MDYLQYGKMLGSILPRSFSFKPCYKWITFNTETKDALFDAYEEKVLNLVINGLPSIPTS